MKKMNKGGMTKHEETMHGIKPEMKKMKKGGPTSEERMRMGRGLSRVKNQRGR